MDVRIVEFPDTRVAVLTHLGPPAREHETVARMVAWRIANRLPPAKHASYGLHYNDPRKVAPSEYHVDLCTAVDGPVGANPFGIVDGVIRGGRCAVARHVGSRENVVAAAYLYETWLPASGETLRDHPLIFHYVNVGPDIAERDMITDVYLPLV